LLSTGSSASNAALAALHRLPHPLRGGRHVDVVDAVVRSASTRALMTAAGAGVMPPSPPPLMPRGFPAVGSSVSFTAKLGTSCARGSA
jgi:hypothetical protein